MFGFSMHERLTEDKIKLDAGDELDPGIRQTPVTNVCSGQGRSFRIVRNVFKSTWPETCGEFFFGAYFRLLLNRREILELITDQIRPFPLAGTWRRKQSTPRSNPVNSRRYFFYQTCLFCTLLSKSFKTII